MLSHVLDLSRKVAKTTIGEITKEDILQIRQNCQNLRETFVKSYGHGLFFWRLSVMDLQIIKREFEKQESVAFAEFCDSEFEEVKEEKERERVEAQQRLRVFVQGREEYALFSLIEEMKEEMKEEDEFIWSELTNLPF